MNRYRIGVLLIPILSSALVACSSSGDDRDAPFVHITRYDATHVAARAPGLADAIVGADGSLSIDGQPVALTPAQKSDLAGYYAAAGALRAHAVETGKAGLATAATAIGSVVKGFANGDTSHVDADVNAQSAKVEAGARQICVDLAALQVRQDALAATLPSFRPYATITAKEVSDCR